MRNLMVFGIVESFMVWDLERIGEEVWYIKEIVMGLFL